MAMGPQGTRLVQGQAAAGGVTVGTPARVRASVGMDMRMRGVGSPSTALYQEFFVPSSPSAGHATLTAS